jgi:uncharacterized protein
MGVRPLCRAFFTHSPFHQSPIPAVIIGVITWELEIFGAQSLKEKRSVVKSLKDRLHDRFNVSAAETKHQDVWQRTEITACVVAGTRKVAESVLQSCDDLVTREARARIIQTYRQIL